MKQNRIDLKFQKDKKLLSIYFSAGFPNLEDTVPILKNLQAAGVDMVEIGLPFSDPLADGRHTAASNAPGVHLHTSFSPQPCAKHPLRSEKGRGAVREFANEK